MLADLPGKWDEMTRRCLKGETVLSSTWSNDLPDRDTQLDTNCREDLCRGSRHAFLVPCDLLHHGRRRAIERYFAVLIKEVEPDCLFALQVIEISAQFVRSFCFVHHRGFLCFHRHDAVQRHLPAVFIEARQQRRSFQRGADEHDDDQEAEEDFEKQSSHLVSGAVTKRERIQISDAAHTLDAIGTVREWSNLFPQVADVRVDAAIEG